MREFIVPEDGFIVKTQSGRPLFELVIHDQGNVLKIFGADGEPKLALATEGDGGALIMGDPPNNGIVLSARDDASELGVMYAAKKIIVAIDGGHSELRFMNSADLITTKLYADDNGGQFGLGNQEGNLVVSAGAEDRGGVCHLMNSNGDTVVLLQSREESGSITLLDEDHNVRVVI